MTIQLFSSGSIGNCCLVKTPNNNILIDVGISKKCIIENLEKNNLTLTDISIILITHAHEDHIRSLGSIIKVTQAIIYMSLGTYNDIMNSKDKRIVEIVKFKKETGQINFICAPQESLLYYELDLNGDIIKPFPTFHDATESVGYIINSVDKKIVYVTDTGYIHHTLLSLLTDADAYVIESNYDPFTLMNSDRPYYNKMRTLSDHGHMSNEDAMVVLAKVMGPKTKLVMHAHISLECNLSQIVIDTREKVLNDYGICTEGITFVITSPNPTKEYEL